MTGHPRSRHWRPWLLGIATALCGAGASQAGPYAPAAGQPGSTAIAADDPRFAAWGSAQGAVLHRGKMDLSDFESPAVDFGGIASAVGPPNVVDAAGVPIADSRLVVSLGDAGWIDFFFPVGIHDGVGPDLAIFENAFNDTFLELAFVEVSSDGMIYYRFPNASLTQTTRQIDQTVPAWSAIDPTNIDGLAGKYRAGWGTPFDLAALAGMPGLDTGAITHVRIVDVVGSINPGLARLDSSGRKINDPFPTPFITGGFDLDAIGIINYGTMPEPGSGVLTAVGVLLWLGRRTSRRP